MNNDNNIEILDETVNLQNNQLSSQEDVKTEEIQNDDNQVEIPVIEKVIVEDVEKEKKKKVLKKKVLIIIIVVLAILGILLAIFVPVFLSKSKKENTIQPRIISNNPYEATLKSTLTDGSLKKEIKKALNTNDIQTNQVELISFDIDSDNDQELIAYAEDETKKFILQFEVDESIFYEDSFPVDGKDSIGLVYSLSSDKLFWEIESAGKHTIVSDTKYIIQEDVFLNEYFLITKTYKDKSILGDIVLYELNDKLNIDKILQNKITNEKILDELKINIEDIKTNATENKKQKEQEEAQRRAEENANNNLFQINGRNLLFGNYIANSENPVVSNIIIEKNGTAVLDGSACTWKREDYEFLPDSAPVTVESIALLCSNQTYYYTAVNDFELTNAYDSTLVYNAE